MKRVSTFLCLLTLLVTATFVVTLDVSAEAIYEIRAVHKTSHCIDIKGSRLSNGTEAQIYSCNNQPNQRFKLVNNGSNLYKIVALHSVNSSGGEKCLDVQGAHTDEGRNVQLYSCHGGSNQLWEKIQDGGLNHFEFIADHSDKCLHANNGEGVLTRRDRLEQRACDNDDNQKWILQVAANCPNQICESSEGENATNCPEDCAIVNPPACNYNGLCEPGENCSNCSYDCGACAPSNCNNNGSCDLGEDCNTCPGDCPFLSGPFGGLCPLQ